MRGAVHSHSVVHGLQRPGESSVKWASCHEESGPGYSQASPGLLPACPINLLCLYSELWLQYARKNTRFFLVRKHEMTLKGTVEGSRQKVKVYDGVSRGLRSPRNQAGLPALSKKDNVPPGPAQRDPGKAPSAGGGPLLSARTASVTEVVLGNGGCGRQP